MTEQKLDGKDTVCAGIPNDMNEKKKNVVTIMIIRGGMKRVEFLRSRSSNIEGLVETMRA